jgi:hypothetical protein
MMQSIGGRVRNPRWVALGTDEFAAWLSGCHGDPNVFLRVFTHLMDTIDKLELVGPRTDRKWAKKLRGFDGLGEVRYNDNAGAFRAFFKFGRRNGQPVIVFADGDSKTADDFLHTRYERADRAIDEAMAAHGIVFARDW